MKRTHITPSVDAQEEVTPTEASSSECDQPHDLTQEVHETVSVATICTNGNVKVADSATLTDYLDRQALRHVRMLFGGKW